MFRFPGERKLRLSAAELNRQSEAADRVAFGRKGITELTLPEDQQSHWVWIRNDSGTDRERFDCMSLGDPLFDLVPDGTADLLFSADDAASDKTPVILLEPIEDGEFGKGVIHGLVVAKVAAGSTTATTAAPDASGALEPGDGSIKLLGSPDDTDETLLPVLLGVGSSAAAERAILRLGFEGRDSSNAHKWDEFFGALLGWISFSDYSGGGDIAAPSLGVSVVTNTGTGAPADAEMLHFDNAGTYRLTIAYQVGVDSNSYAMRSACTVQWLGGGASGDTGVRYLQFKGTGFQSGGNVQTILDHRVIKTTGSNDLHIGVSALEGTGTPPAAIGWISIE